MDKIGMRGSICSIISLVLAIMFVSPLVLYVLPVNLAYLTIGMPIMETASLAFGIIGVFLGISGIIKDERKILAILSIIIAGIAIAVGLYYNVVFLVDYVLRPAPSSST